MRRRRVHRGATDSPSQWPDAVSSRQHLSQGRASLSTDAAAAAALRSRQSLLGLSVPQEYARGRRQSVLLILTLVPVVQSWQSSMAIEQRTTARPLYGSNKSRCCS